MCSIEIITKGLELHASYFFLKGASLFLLHCTSYVVILSYLLMFIRKYVTVHVNLKLYCQCKL
jgi:hypothetical protein